VDPTLRNLRYLGTMKARRQTWPLSRGVKRR
jgi:hypothetical protein